MLARDERNAVYMADAYAKLSFKPGVVEGPSVGSIYMLPGVAEAYKSSTPLIIITTDTPLYGEKVNYLTALDQSSLFKPITKETITVTKADEIVHAIRRAFRLSTSGKPGPVHVRILRSFRVGCRKSRIKAAKGVLKISIPKACSGFSNDTEGCGYDN